MPLVVSPPELVVVAKPEVRLRATSEGLKSLTSTPIESIEAILASENATLRPLFGLSQELLERWTGQAGDSAVDGLNPSNFLKVVAPEEKLESLADRFRGSPLVDAAYLKPQVELAMIDPRINIQPGSTPTETTKDFTKYQTYLEAGPGGINARYSWGIPGGAGRGVKIIDVEGAWRFCHEDLLQNSGGMVMGIASPDLHTRNHGTAVLGILGGDHNSLGISGICPDANTSGLSMYVDPQPPYHGLGIAAAIWLAADKLDRGHIMILELHSPGPLAHFKPRKDQYGYIPVEWWPDAKLAVEHAKRRGVLVVAAAGNGSVSLDAEIYDQGLKQFPAEWSNPFRRGAADTGSILVGAGAPPPGTNDQNWGPDRSRLYFSNYGKAVDAQGWGYEVTTCAFGDLQQGEDENLWYTKTFRGTSSATPMVAGALACVQGVLKTAGASPLDFTQARDLLYKTGSPQLDAPSRPANQKIGNRPDLQQMLSHLPVPLVDRSAGTDQVVKHSFRSLTRSLTKYFLSQWHIR
jgi:hypothetical protein